MKLGSFFFTFSFLLAAVTLAGAQTAKPTKLDQQFIDLQRTQDDAEGNKDIAALERIFSDDFVFIAANGSSYDKKKFLDEIKADTEPLSQEKLTYENFKVRLYGKTAVTNYLLVVPIKDKDPNRFRMSTVWVKQKGNWRLANIHATRVRN